MEKTNKNIQNGHKNMSVAPIYKKDLRIRPRAYKISGRKRTFYFFLFIVVD